MPFDGTETPLSARALMLLLDMERLIEGGWLKGDWARSGRYCIVGALNKAQGRRPSSIKSDHLGHHDDTARLVLGHIKTVSGLDACEFNDMAGVRKRHVLNLLGQVKTRLVETVDAV